MEVGGGVEGGDVYAIIHMPYSQELFVGGNFTKAGSIDAHSIAHWTRKQLGISRRRYRFNSTCTCI